MDTADELVLYDQACSSRLLLGTAAYPSPQTLIDAIVASGTAIITVSVRRESSTMDSGQAFRRLLGEAGARLLPNTAGCCTVKEAVNTAMMARELFGTPWIKLEVIADHRTLQPDVFGLVEAAGILCDEGFQVFPYTTDDLVVAARLLDAGCRVLMPWGAPIGSGRGLNDPYALSALRAAHPEVPMIVDAGLGQPSHACEALQMGMDAVLLNTAVARAGDPVRMAEAFAQAVRAGRGAHLAGAMLSRDLATPSSPQQGTPFSTPS